MKVRGGFFCVSSAGLRSLYELRAARPKDLMLLQLAAPTNRYAATATQR